MSAILDLREWYVQGKWVASEDEGLILARSETAAEEIARDHNALVAEVGRLRLSLGAIRELTVADRPYDWRLAEIDRVAREDLGSRGCGCKDGDEAWANRCTRCGFFESDDFASPATGEQVTQ